MKWSITDNWGNSIGEITDNSNAGNGIGVIGRFNTYYWGHSWYYSSTTTIIRIFAKLLYNYIPYNTGNYYNQYNIIC